MSIIDLLIAEESKKNKNKQEEVRVYIEEIFYNREENEKEEENIAIIQLI